MGGFPDVRAVKFGESLPESLHEGVLDILVQQQVVGSYAGLPRVQGLSPGDTPRSHLQVGLGIYYAGALASEFEHDRGQMLRGGLHGHLAEFRAAGQKNQVETAGEKFFIHLPVAFDDGDIFRSETFLNHTAQHGGHRRSRRGGLEHGRASCGDGSGKRAQQQLDGIIPG